MSQLSYYLIFVFALAVAGLLAGGDAAALIATQVVMSVGLVAVWRWASRH